MPPDPHGYLSTPDQSHPGQSAPDQSHPGAPQAYSGESAAPQGYSGQSTTPQGYSGEPGTPQGYSGEPRMPRSYSGQPGADQDYSGRPEADQDYLPGRFESSAGYSTAAPSQNESPLTHPNQPTSGQPAPPYQANSPEQRPAESEETSRLGYGQPGVETRWNPTTGPLPRRIPTPSAEGASDQPEIIDGEIVETEIVETEIVQSESAYSPRRAEPPVDAEVIPEPTAPTTPTTPTAPPTADEPEMPKPKLVSPANSVEESLREAAEAGSTDRFLSTLLLARVLIPGWDGDGPLDAAEWATNDLPDGLHLIVFTSHERMAEHLGEDVQGSWIKFTKLIRSWPGPSIAFAVNPESQIGATLPGDEVVQLANWAAESGLGADDPEEAVAKPAAEEASAPRPTFEPQAQTGPIMMQKPITPEQLSYYLERGYDRVSGFVHRAGEVAHLKSPEQLYLALGLNYAGSSFDPHATEAYVLRWRAYRANLYRIPYGGQHEAGMRAMEGWVIERPPFRGNGFAPSETNDVIAEFKVDSARLPHNAQIWRLHGEGEEELIAVLDADGPRWRPAGES